MRRTTSFLIVTLVLLLGTGVCGCRTLVGTGPCTGSISESITVQATALPWITSPQMISDNQSSADLSPELIVDANGVVHALWREETGGSLSNLTYASSADGFSTNHRIRTLVQLHVPTMAVDSLGVVHVFWLLEPAGDLSYPEGIICLKYFKINFLYFAFAPISGVFENNSDQGLCLSDIIRFFSVLPLILENIVFNFTQNVCNSCLIKDLN